MVLVIRLQFGAAKSAEPWSNVPENLIETVGRGRTSGAEVANKLEGEGWQIVSVVQVTNSGNYDQELWFRKD